MLLELTPDEAESLIPIVPTGVQYSAYWNDARKTTGRIITVVLVGVGLLLFSNVFPDDGFFSLLLLLGGFLTLLYPFLWGPLYVISRRNIAFREIPYTGIFFGKVLKVRRLTVLIEELEKVDEYGEIYIEEVRERQFEMEVGDETGVTYKLRAKDDPRYGSIVKRQSVIGLVKAYSRDLQRRPSLSEFYVVKLGEWVGTLSYLNRDLFLDVSNQLLAEVEQNG